MLKRLAVLLLFAFMQPAHAHILADNAATQIVIPGYQPPGKQTQSQPVGSPQDKANQGNVAQNPVPPPTTTPPAPVVAPKPLAKGSVSAPKKPSLPALVPTGKLVPESTNDFYSNLSQCQPGSFQNDDAIYQIIGWEKGRCHVKMTSKAPDGITLDCYPYKIMVYNLTVTVSSYHARTTPYTFQNVTWAINAFMNQCRTAKSDQQSS